MVRPETIKYAKELSGLTPELEAHLQAIGGEVIPHLDRITDRFYEELFKIPTARPFLEGRLERLKKTHRQWLEMLFTHPYDEEMVAYLHRVGERHVQVGLPIELMAGAMTIIERHLQGLFFELWETREKLQKSLEAVTACLGFSLQVMQDAYQTSTLAAELEKFLEITGINRRLFENLARAQQRRQQAA